ncbi:hypothetical protein ACF1BS_16830 [Streptomyces sp. NPDC014748]
MAGTLTRGPDFAAVLERARPTGPAPERLLPCAGVPLVLVVGGA